MQIGRTFSRALAAGVLLTFGAFAAPGIADAQELRLDPTKVVGPDTCGECHKESVKAWKESHHAETFQELPRNKKSREIASNLGIRRIKGDSTCLSCHFTVKMEEGEPEAVAGISCESCHGAGKDYYKVHSSFGDKDATAETESEEHRTQRWADAEAGGMIRPTDLYALAENCFQCHTVPNEELVNKGGHTAGSNFELVSWSQGEVRHNVWYSKENNEADQNRRRMMLVVGQLLDLEYSLRGVAKATQKADYAVSMAKRAKTVAGRVQQIQKLLGDAAPELNDALAAAGGASLKLNNEAELLDAASKVQAAAKALAKNHDGSGFGAVDKAMPGSDKYKGDVVQP